MKKHQQTSLTIRGKTISVDVGVRELIRQLNALPGVETYYSCQGHGGNRPPMFISAAPAPSNYYCRWPK